MTQAQFEQLCKRAGAQSPNQATKEKASKLKNVKKMVDGITFDSSLEAKAFQFLKLWQLSGAISDLRMQPAFTLQERFKDGTGKTIRSITYSADFRFFDTAQRRIRYVDAKGHVTQIFLRTMKMMKEKFPDVEIEIWDKDKVRELARC